MPIAAIIAIVALVGGGASFAAQGALPGDAFYPVKVSVNERIAAAFQFSADAKANYEAVLAARRLEEAGKLAAAGRIDADARATIEERFAVHAERVEAWIEEMQARGNARAAVDLASRFETSLRAHDEILATLEARSETVRVELRSIEAKLNAVLRVIVSARGRAEADVVAEENASPEAKAEVKVAAEGKIGAAENVIASVKSYLETKKAQLGAEATAEVEARLKAAEDLVLEAKAKVSAETYAEAFNCANQAIRVAQEARMLVEARTELEVDVKLGPPIIDMPGRLPGSTKVEGSGTLKLDVGF